MLGVCAEVDVALDAFPYNGVATTCELLWMGVPVVNLEGRTHQSRAGASLLRAGGLAGLVAATPDEYVRCAANLATDLTRLSEIRSTLRERLRVVLTDARGFAASVESAYRTAWTTWAELNSHD